MPLIESASGHPQDKKISIISLMIDISLSSGDYVFQDLNNGKEGRPNTGAEGISAEQVLRTAVVTRLYSFTFEQLAFHLYDSRALRRFCR